MERELPSNLSDARAVAADFPTTRETQYALHRLNNKYPGERKKKFPLRDPNYVMLREEILNGNLEIMDKI